MNIASAEVVPYALAFKKLYVTATGSLEQREMVLLRIRDEDGNEGLGEAVPLALRGGADIRQVVNELSAWAAEPVFPELVDNFGFSAPTLCAIRTAHLDLTSKRAGVPAWHELTFGAGDGAPVQCNATLVAGTPREVAEDAEEWLERGFSTFKLKVGEGIDLDIVEAVRDTVGEDARIRVDANGTWSVEAALDALTMLEDFDLELVEQPVADLEKMAALKDDIDLLIAADESVADPMDAQDAFQEDACDLITVKLSKAGLMDLSHFRDTFPVYVSSALDGPVGIAAAAHAVQGLRNEELDAGIAHGLATQHLFDDTIAAVECEMAGDMLHLPDGPGLGVVIDEDALTRNRL